MSDHVIAAMTDLAHAVGLGVVNVVVLASDRSEVETTIHVCSTSAWSSALVDQPRLSCSCGLEVGPGRDGDRPGATSGPAAFLPEPSSAGHRTAFPDNRTEGAVIGAIAASPGPEWPEGTEGEVAIGAVVECAASLLPAIVSAGLARYDRMAMQERQVHGLKSALTGARNFLSLLEENADIAVRDPMVSQSLPNAMTILDDAIAQLQRGDSARLSPQLDEYQTVDVEDAIVRSTVLNADRLGRAIGRRPLRVSSDTAASLVATVPYQAIVTVLRNIIGNAIKYMSQDLDEEPWLHVSAEGVEGRLVVTVSDNGIGVPHDEREQVFVEGYRSEAARRVDPAGLGIGLSDCRAIMAAIDGTIELVYGEVSLLGAPSTSVRITLPLHGPSGAGDRSGPSPVEP